MKEEDRLDIMRRLGAKTNINLNDLRTYWRRYSESALLYKQPSSKKAVDKFSAAMKEAGIELEEEHN